MATRAGLLRHLWDIVINAPMRPEAFKNTVQNCERRPSDSFADTGPAITRILAAGVSPRDLSLVCRYAAYEAVFSTLYSLDDPGVEDGDVFMLHEGLLTADPSGMEGRPGSANAV